MKRQSSSRNWVVIFFSKCRLDILLAILLSGTSPASVRFQSKHLCCRGSCVSLNKRKPIPEKDRLCREMYPQLPIHLCYALQLSREAQFPQLQSWPSQFSRPWE